MADSVMFAVHCNLLQRIDDSAELSAAVPSSGTSKRTELSEGAFLFDQTTQFQPWATACFMRGANFVDHCVGHISCNANQFA